MTDNLIMVTVYLIVTFIIFLLLRSVNCWYWEIDERIKLQKEHNLLLNQIFESLANQVPNSRVKTDEARFSWPDQKDVKDTEAFEKLLKFLPKKDD